MSEIIRATGITKVYGTRNQVRALDDVDLTIEAGEYISIRGPSGSGKSTLLNILGCLDRPTSGKLVLDGVDVEKQGDGELSKIRRDKIGFIFQSFNLLPILNAVENVELPMENLKMTPKERRDRAMKLLGTVGLKDRWNHKPKEMSGGEKQRVAIARALANDPSVVLADEPTGNLDSRTGKSIMKLLGELNHNTGTTVIVVTHDISIAKATQRQLYVEDGRIKEKTRNLSGKKEIGSKLKLPPAICNKLVKAGYGDLGKVLRIDPAKLSRVKGLKRREITQVLDAIKTYI